MCESGRMAQTSSILLNAGDRERLTALVADRNRPHKHVQRARIIICSDERLPVLQIAKRVGVSRPAVWRWQQRFAEEGVEGLLRDKTRPPGKPPVPPETVAQVLAITCSEPPGEVTHWTARRRGAGRPRVAHDPADLAGPPRRAPSRAHLQALERSGVCREGGGHCRALHEPTRARCRPVHRREEPDPSAQPYPTRPARPPGPPRDHDA